MNDSSPKPMIVGRPVLLVMGHPSKVEHMLEETKAAMLQALVQAARDNDVPIIRFEERGGLTAEPGIRPRSENGREPVHGENGPDYVLSKWRHSGFKGTDLTILLKGLDAQTLILAGYHSDVAIHYTFVDAHQHDFFARVAEDSLAGSSDAAHDYALTAMEYLQAGARRTTAELIDGFSKLA